MRIWHQSLTVLGDVPGYQDALQRHINTIVEADTEVVLHGLLPGTFPTEFPLAELHYPALASFHYNQLLNAAITAEQQGFDAFAMCFLAGPLLREIRAAVNIPVVNYGEGAFHLASFYGKNFGVMRFTENMREYTQEFVDAWGFSGQCVGIAACGLSYREVFGAFGDHQKAVRQFEDATRAFIKASGAQVIVPGEMPLNVLLAMNGVSRVDDVPIMDGLSVTLMLAEMMAKMHKRGLFHSRHGRSNARPPVERLLEVAKQYGLERMYTAPAISLKEKK